MSSPYAGLDKSQWKSKTEDLVNKHPLDLCEVKELSLNSWKALWETDVGSGSNSFPLEEISPPAQVVGYFFENLLARELSQKYPGEWRGEVSGSDKDLVYMPDENFSTEVKSSGQLGDKVFGNRSYGQTADESSKKGDKSGYYITVNFYNKTLTLLRFGWIDFDDWSSQDAASGQAATLSDDVYMYKLIDIFGEYRQEAPVQIIDGVGPVTAEDLHEQDIYTVGDLIDYDGSDSTPHRFKDKALSFVGMDGEGNQNSLFS